MKKFLLVTAAFLAAITNSSAQCTELFISEYVEGSGNNKAIEFFNPTNAPINLTGYTIERYSNGALDGVEGGITPLAGTVGASDVWVLTNGQTVAAGTSPAADPALQILGDQQDQAYPAATYMNGDDAIVLKKNGVIVDIFGKIGEDPGTAWTNEFPFTGDGTWITNNHTMIRKASVTQGISTNPDFFDPLAQYDSLPSNTWTNLGTHQCVCAVGIATIDAPTVTVFPNPASAGELHLNSSAAITQIEISDMTGRTVFVQSNTSGYSNQMIASIPSFTAGIYTVRILHHDNSMALRKISLR